MALAIRTTFSSTDNATNSWTTAALSVDDIIFVVQQTAFRASSDLVTPTGATGVTAWASFVTLTSEGTVMMRGWWSRVTVAGTKTITFAPAGSLNTNSLTGIVLSGVNITSPIAGTVSTATATNISGMSIPSVTPGTTNAMLVGVWGGYGGGGALGTLTPPASMTQREQTNLSTSNANLLATQALTSSGATGTRTATASGTSEHAAGILWAVNPATSAPPPGGSLGVDVSSPNRATNTTGTSVTTASFTPPASSVLLVCTSGSGNSNTNPTVAITSSGPVGAWTQIGLANQTTTSSSSYGLSAMHWAPVTSSAAVTVTATQTSASMPTTVKVYVLTGVGTSGPVGATPTIGSSTATDFDTTAITTTSNGSYVFCAAAEWKGASHTVSSSNLEFSAFSTNGSSTLDGLSGYIASPTVGTAQTCNLRTNNTSALWTYVAAEIVPAGQKIVVAGIVTAEAFGDFTSQVLPPGPRNLTVPGIPSAEAVAANHIVSAGTYQPITVDSIGSGEIFGATLVQPDVFVSPRVIAVRPTPTYDLVCVARVPATTGAPTFLEVDPIDWTGLSYTDELSRPQQLNAGCKISNLTESVLRRLTSLHDNPTEIWLYRNGRRIFSGPLWAFQVQGESISLNAQGALSYLKGWWVTADKVFKQIDQFAIVTGLIDSWQNQTYGHVGIDTSGIPPSGVVRDASYLAKEEHNIFQRVYELGARENGFDISIDPASRKLKLSYPFQGVNRSAGEDAIVFDSRNITSPNVVCSVAPGDVASEGIGTGTSTKGTLYSTKSNLELRSKFGRFGFAANFDGVSEQTTLDGHTQGLVDARGEALLIPGPDVRGTTDADVSAYDVGDTVSYELHQRLGLRGAFRLRKRSVSVKKTGTEAITLQFV